MLKFSPYSVSKIECFLQCARRFKYRYIEKPPIKQSFYHLEKGKLWHKLTELKLQNKIDTFKKPKFKELTQSDYISELKNIKNFFSSDMFNSYRNPIWFNQKHEYYFCVNDKFETCDKKEGLILGYVDLLQYDKHSIEIIDWKTGKKPDERFPKSNLQLDIYACVMSKLFNVKDITGKYVFVEHDYEQVKNKFDYDVIWNTLLETIYKIENCKEFECNYSVLCNWCPYYDLCH